MGGYLRHPGEGKQASRFRSILALRIDPYKEFSTDTQTCVESRGARAVPRAAVWRFIRSRFPKSPATLITGWKDHAYKAFLGESTLRKTGFTNLSTQNPLYPEGGEPIDPYNEFWESSQSCLESVVS